MTTDLTLESPTERKLPEGWHFTERYGEVFVSPGGVAWVVRQVGNELKSVSVKISPADIVKTPSVDRLKQTRARKGRLSRQVKRTKTAGLSLQSVGDSKQAVMAVAK